MNKLLWSQDEYLRAYNFAALAHRGQLVPGTDLPYVTHISLVSMEIMAVLSVETRHNGNFALQCALLHDVVEDAGVTDEQVRAEFGEAVAKGVAALSKNSKLEKKVQMADSLRRIKEQPREVWMVKLTGPDH